MRKSKFSPIQIVKILKGFNQGKTAKKISRDYSISKATFYKWRECYVGMTGKELEDENRKLK